MKEWDRKAQKKMAGKAAVMAGASACLGHGPVDGWVLTHSFKKQISVISCRRTQRQDDRHPMTAASPTSTSPAQPQTPDIAIERSGHTATAQLCRPPHNFFVLALISGLVEAFEALQADPQCRAIVLAAQGRSFCAGADFSAPEPVAGERREPSALYRQAGRVLAVTQPGGAALQGPPVGGGGGAGPGSAGIRGRYPGRRGACPRARSRWLPPCKGRPWAAPWGWRWWPTFAS